MINPHVSVDCVVLGFDGEHLKVLLVKQTGHEESGYYNNMKLPGSLIYNDEDLDEAAQRVLYELTGLNELHLIQFRAFGSKNRTNNPKDIKWLERFHQLNQKVERIVTITYLTMVKIDKKLTHLSDRYEACWTEMRSALWLSTTTRLSAKPYGSCGNTCRRSPLPCSTFSPRDSPQPNSAHFTKRYMTGNSTFAISTNGLPK